MNTASNRKSTYARVMMKISSLLFLVIIFSSHARAQNQDTAKVRLEKEYKNTAKLNITSWILYSGGVQFAYERVLSKKRSITLFGGYIEFPMPSLIENSPLNFNKNKSKSGFAIGSEYRFYLAKENKYPAPHGVFLAPFVSFYHFDNQRSGYDTTNMNSNLTLTTTFNFLNIGAELGYQFVIRKRFVVDCVMFGPAISSYYFGLKLTGNNSGDYSDKVQAILDALKDKYPLLKNLSNGEKISTSGISNFWSLGFRYVIQIGYRF